VRRLKGEARSAGKSTNGPRNFGVPLSEQPALHRLVPISYPWLYCLILVRLLD
jgi:hypothetical protein